MLQEQNEEYNDLLLWTAPSSSELNETTALLRLREEVVVVGYRNVRSCDDLPCNIKYLMKKYFSNNSLLTCEPSSVQSVDCRHCCGYIGTLDVHIALRRSLVHVDVSHSSVLVALLDNVVSDLLVPVRVSLHHGVEHVGQHEALGGDGRARLLLRLGRLGRLQRKE